MRIIFVRHGHPDYRKDCLTDMGLLHANAAAERLKNEQLSEIYSSTCGRAYETAERIAALHGMDVIGCDFMREIGWGSVDEEPITKNGHPWFTAEELVSLGLSVSSPTWDSEEPFSRNTTVRYVHNVEQNFDAWLESFGYKRSGLYYRVTKANDKNVMMVSHAGSSSAALSHLLNIPFPQYCANIQPDFTAITVITLTGSDGELISPKVEILNDARHISEIETEKVYEK